MQRKILAVLAIVAIAVTFAFSTVPSHANDVTERLLTQIKDKSKERDGYNKVKQKEKWDKADGELKKLIEDYQAAKAADVTIETGGRPFSERAGR